MAQENNGNKQRPDACRNGVGTGLTNDLPKRLRTVSDMIHMGEKIRWGEETTLMDEAADEIERLRRALQWEAMTPGMKLAAWAEHLYKKIKKHPSEYRDTD
jgi:hypothetical protein